MGASSAALKQQQQQNQATFPRPVQIYAQKVEKGAYGACRVSTWRARQNGVEEVERGCSRAAGPCQINSNWPSHHLVPGRTSLAWYEEGSERARKLGLGCSVGKRLVSDLPRAAPSSSAPVLSDARESGLISFRSDNPPCRVCVSREKNELDSLPSLHLHNPPASL